VAVQVVHLDENKSIPYILKLAVFGNTAQKMELYY
jgi:hypothetical protein